VGRVQTLAVELDGFVLGEPGPLDSHTLNPEEPGTLEIDLVLERLPDEDSEAAAGPSGGAGSGAAATDAAASAEKRRRSGTWSGFVSGEVRGLRGAPLPATLVSVNGVFTYADHDGRFRLDEVPLPLVGGGVEIQLRPPPGLHLPRRHFEPMPERARGGVGPLEIELKSRPVAKLDVRGYEALGGAGSPLRGFWYLTTVGDALLGRERDAGALLHCVTYDGTWLHLPPLPKPGRVAGGVTTDVEFVRTSPRGLLTAVESWIPAPDRIGVLRPQFPPRHVTLRIAVPADYKGGRVVLEQLAPVMAARRRGADADDEPAFPEIQVGRHVEQSAKRQNVTVSDLAPGTWTVALSPPAGKALPTLRKTVTARTSKTVKFKSRSQRKTKDPGSQDR
jgi:hypothetical protein